MSFMIGHKRIPRAPAVLWRRIRLQALPAVGFVLAIVTCVWLWQRPVDIVRGVGEVESLRVNVTSPAAGRVVAMPHQTGGQWNLYDFVRSGDVIARLDDRQLQISKDHIYREIKRLADGIQNQQADSAAANREVSDAIDAVWQFELTRLKALEQRLAEPSHAGAEHAGLSVPPPDPPAAAAAATRDSLSQLRNARRDLELRYAEFDLQTKSLEIRAPISGTLVAVHCWPGQTLQPGGMIATIAADHGRHIVSYLPEESSIVPEAGMQVTVLSRTNRSWQATCEIEQVGRQIEAVPVHQWPAAALPQWGLPVRIALPGDTTLRPGALVDVVFHDAGSL
jgi:multidrug resistance efflux pump